MDNFKVLTLYRPHSIMEFLVMIRLLASSLIIFSTLMHYAAGKNTDHWSLLPIKKVQVPDTMKDPWVKNPIDAFILKKLRKKGMEPQPSASSSTLMRRLHAGLTGKLPSINEITQFTGNQSDEKYGILVDELLESPHYGERWARHWLDVARYGESDGILTVNEDKVRVNAWKYRDSVISAFNKDLPFDQFVRYQLSPTGNEIPDNYKELKQFVQLGTKLQNNANPNDKQFHHLNDIVSTTGSAFLGLSFGCARCHDHPVDPMTTEEYYQFTAIFFEQFKVQPKASSKTIPLRVTTPTVLKNGDWKSLGKKVTPGFLNVLMKKPNNYWLDLEDHKMLSLGNWLTDSEHGAGNLLARVIINRLWHYHFGQGIVKTPNDFGIIGSTPSHPNLLDWLAGELIKREWKLKPIQKLIVSSATYRQKNSFSTEYLKIDSDNTLLWHRKPHRLEAEAIRDRMLDVAGVLNKQMYGPSIPIGNYKKTFDDSPKTWRRSIYLQAHRAVEHPTLSLFNSPNTEVSVGARSTSTGEESTLFALNSKLSWELADHFAKRIDGYSAKNSDQIINNAYMLALSRPPSQEETAIGLDLLGNGEFDNLVKFCHVLLGINEFIYIH